MKKHYWNEYQKEIANDHYFYCRSCIRQTFFPGSETTFLKIMRDVLGKDIQESAGGHTCTGIGYHSDIVPFETTMTMIARLFALMTEQGYENFAPSCITSFGLYNEIIETWKHNPELLEKIRNM
jgi:heterodisulfide reductase subunit B